MRAIWVVAAIGMMMALAGRAPGVEVEVVVRGPEGKVVAGRQVELMPKSASARRDKPDAVQVTTDENGVAKFWASEGVTGYAVKAPGVGYGKIGETELVAGKVARLHLPALAPFAVIEGTVPAGARVAGTLVYGYRTFSDDDQPTAEADAEGHFRFTDVRAGEWYLWVGHEQQRFAQSPHAFTVRPGVTVRDVRLDVMPAEKTKPQPAMRRAPLPGENQTVTWAEGTVRDEAGKGIAGATVYALAVYHGGMRMYEMMAKATTNEQGHYELKGAGGLSSFSATLVAKAPGRVAAWAWPAFPRPKDEWVEVGAATKPAAPLPAARQDFVLSATGGALEVTVLQQGKPVPGAAVSVYLQNASLKDEWAAETGDAADRAAIMEAAYPSAVSDEQGVARLKNLVPGVYEIVASSNDMRATRAIHEGTFREDEKEPYGLAQGIAVQQGKTARLRMGIYPPGNRSAMRFLTPDGSPMADRPNFEYGRLGDGGRSTSMVVDETGKGEFLFSEPGIWQVCAGYRVPAATRIPISPPCFSASGIVAVSPSLQGNFVPTFTAQHLALASLRVTVEDGSGKPVRAVVEIGSSWNRAIFSGSTDEKGEVLFTGIRPWDEYSVRAFVGGEETAGGGQEDLALSEVEKRSGRKAYLAQRYAARVNVESRLTMRPEAVGYVRGVLRPVADKHSTLQTLYVVTAGTEDGEEIHVRASTGEFVAGPLREGEATFVVSTVKPGEDENLQRFSTRVHAGKVERLDLNLRAASERLTSTAGGSIYVSADGAAMPMQGAQRLKARVFHADGVSPAFGAQVFYFEPGERTPAVLGIADASGTVQPRGFWRHMNESPTGAKAGPAERTYAAFLPGSCGVTVVTGERKAGQELRFELPAPLAISGSVTVGGESPGKRAGMIRVIAACEDRGFLNELFSVETTADVDGKFVLGGLTPGNYRVQASLDDIWLSESVVVKVGQRDEAVALAIGEPGAPVAVRVRDAAGKGVAGATVVVDRPKGPLAERFWPRTLEADGAGVVWIPTLEAGAHRVRVGTKEQVVKVPALPVEKAVEVEVSGG